MPYSLIDSLIHSALNTHAQGRKHPGRDPSDAQAELPSPCFLVSGLACTFLCPPGTSLTSVHYSSLQHLPSALCTSSGWLEAACTNVATSCDGWVHLHHLMRLWSHPDLRWSGHCLCPGWKEVGGEGSRAQCQEQSWLGRSLWGFAAGWAASATSYLHDGQ